jgi:hypothetical protein
MHTVKISSIQQLNAVHKHFEHTATHGPIEIPTNHNFNVFHQVATVNV